MKKHRSGTLLDWMRHQPTRELVSCVALFIAGSMMNPALADTPLDLTISEIVELPSNERESIDLIVASIACAKNLPGAENLDAERCVRKIDEWVEKVRVATVQATIEFRAHPERYRNSENRFKAEVLMSAVRDVLSVEYNPTLPSTISTPPTSGNRPALDAQRLFLTGILENRSKATNVSMPFLCLALGRRLRYPLKLASAENRLRLRWDGDERFDVEWPSFNTPMEFRELPVPEALSHFHTGSNEDTRVPEFHLLTGDDELSMLLNNRGACLENQGRNNEAIVAYAQAHRVSPNCLNHTAALARVVPKVTWYYGRTGAMYAPDYSHRIDSGVELAKSNAEWDRMEQEYFSKLPPAKTVAEQTERMRQQEEFRRRRIEAQNEILLREALQKNGGGATIQPGLLSP